MGELIRRGDTGQKVRDLQTSLNFYAAAGLAQDGIFGPKTQTAVKSFQAAHGLVADGIVGKDTGLRLLALALPPPDASQSQVLPPSINPLPGQFVLSGNQFFKV